MPRQLSTPQASAHGPWSEHLGWAAMSPNGAGLLTVLQRSALPPRARVPPSRTSVAFQPKALPWHCQPGRGFISLSLSSPLWHWAGSSS